MPIYFSDPIVRRSPPLQATRAAQPPRALANARTLAAFGVAAGDKVRARQGEASALLDVALDDTLPDGVVRISAAHASDRDAGPDVRPDHAGARLMDAVTAVGSQTLGVAWPVVWSLAKIVAIVLPILLMVAYLT